MMTLDQLTAFLGWASVINIGLLSAAVVAMMLMRERVAGVHARMFDLDQQFLMQAYFRYVAQYKIAILIFNLVPYLALKVMS